MSRMEKEAEMSVGQEGLGAGVCHLLCIQRPARAESLKPLIMTPQKRVLAAGQGGGGELPGFLQLQGHPGLRQRLGTQRGPVTGPAVPLECVKPPRDSTGFLRKWLRVPEPWTTAVSGLSWLGLSTPTPRAGGPS